MTEKTKPKQTRLEEIEKMREELAQSFLWLTKKMSLNDDEDEKYFKFVDARQKHAKSILDCIKLENHLAPSEDDDDEDLVSLIKKAKARMAQGGDKKMLMIVRSAAECTKKSLTLLKSAMNVKNLPNANENLSASNRRLPKRAQERGSRNRSLA